MAETPAEPSAASPASEAGAAEPSPQPGFFERIFKVPGRRSPSEPASTPDPEPAATAPTPAAATRPLGELSDAELDELVGSDPRLQRRVQAETDRREARRKADADAEARKKLRREDPYAYAEADEQAEQQHTQQQAWAETFSTFGKQHDEAVLDPLVLALPKAEQERILGLEGAGVGLPGRQLVVREALKALEAHWKAEGKKDAEAHLRKNPAFIKQVLRTGREETDEPEQVSGGAPRRNGRTFEDLILRDYRSQRNS
jgi:hypothetical protein